MYANQILYLQAVIFEIQNINSTQLQNSHRLNRYVKTTRKKKGKTKIMIKLLDIKTRNTKA